MASGLHCTQLGRICIMILAVALLSTGIYLCFLGIRAHTSEEFAELALLLSVESNNVFETDKALLIVIFLSIGAMCCGVSGGLGSWFHNQRLLCCVGTFGVCIGVWLLTVCSAMYVFWTTQGPVIAKSLNRMCGPGAMEPFKADLGCAGMPSGSSKSSTSTLSVSRVEHTGTTPTSSANEGRHASTISTTSGAVVDIAKNIITTSSTPSQLLSEHDATAVRNSTSRPTDRLRKEIIIANGTRRERLPSLQGGQRHELSSTLPPHQSGKKRHLLELQVSSSSFSSSPASSAFFHANSSFHDMPQRGFIMEFVTRLAVAYALAIEAPLLKSQQNTSVGLEYFNGRRLFPGTTEEALLIRVCRRLGPSHCPDPCALLDRFCVEPDGFDPWTACVCDRSGPRINSPDSDAGLKEAACERGDDNPMCTVDRAGRHLGVFCMSPTPELGQGFGKEACFVLPSARCSSGNMPENCGFVEDAPCMSTGPCTNPDSRSRLYIESQSAAASFVKATAFLGSLLMITSVFACCMCAELHTGQRVAAHAQSLADNELGPFLKDDEDEAMPQE